MCEKCSICLVKLKRKGKVVFQCGHAIHLTCYIECLKNDTIYCPLCRTLIEENVSFYNFINGKFSRIIRSFQKICSIEDIKVNIEGLNLV